MTAARTGGAHQQPEQFLPGLFPATRKTRINSARRGSKLCLGMPPAALAWHNQANIDMAMTQRARIKRATLYASWPSFRAARAYDASFARWQMCGSALTLKARHSI